MRKRTLAREYALQMLYQCELNPDGANEIIKSVWSEFPDTDDEVRDFANRIVTGTLERISDLDVVINRYADNWQLSRMAVVDRNILRFATFEILYMEDVPPKVSINEAVNLAKKFSQEDSGKFVNGVLDKINHTEKIPKQSE